MNECLIEQLIKRKTTIGTILKKSALLALTIVLGLASLLYGGLFFLLFAVMVIVDSFVLKRFNVEFEYVYFNGDLDFDKIMNKENRKRLFSTNMKEVMMIAPVGAPQLGGFQTRKTYNFSSCFPEQQAYEMIVNHDGGMVKVIFEPNEKLLTEMKNLAPAKVTIAS